MSMMNILFYNIMLFLFAWKSTFIVIFEPCSFVTIAFLRLYQMAKKARLMHKISQREMNQNAKKGEADRRHLTSRPKHLYSGKRKMGKTDRR